MSQPTVPCFVVVPLGSGGDPSICSAILSGHHFDLGRLGYPWSLWRDCLMFPLGLVSLSSVWTCTTVHSAGPGFLKKYCPSLPGRCFLNVPFKTTNETVKN